MKILDSYYEVKNLNFSDEYEKSAIMRPCVVTNNDYIYTGGMGPCVALGLFVEDENNITHKIIYHCPYADLDGCDAYDVYEGAVERYLKGIGNIKSLKACLASFDTFSELNLDDGLLERNIIILERIISLFSDWSSTHADFEIPIVQSIELGLGDNGSFDVMTDEERRERIKNEPDSNVNTRYRQETLDVNTAYNLLKKLKQSKAQKI